LNSFQRRFLTLLVVIITLIAAGFYGCGGRPNLANLTVRELFDYGMDRYNNQKYLAAVEAFQSVVFNYPGASLIDTAQYYLALSYYGQEEYTLASVEFNRLLLNYPASVFAPQAQLMKAVCFYEGTPENYGLDQSDLEQAIKQFEDFLIDYPESDAVSDARAYLLKAKTRLAKKYYKSAIVYTHLSDYRAARIYFQKVVDDYTDTEYAPDATYQLAECYYQEKNYPEALERFENFRIVFPQNDLAVKAADRACDAAYKGGERAFEKGDLAQARSLFERALDVCSQDEGKVGDVQEYLQKIGEAPVVGLDKADAGS
jgi:outer membrane protein assembly factor BamD